MKKGLSILAGLSAAAILTAYSVSGTYAKYTSTYESSDSARVAKWAFNIGKDSQGAWTAATDDFTFDLFKYTDSNVDVDGNGSENVIAPGTTGSFTLMVQNVSEVNAQVEIDFDETNTAGIPIQYSLDQANWVDSIDSLDLTNTSAISMNMNGDDSKTIYWRWAFEGNSTATGRLAAQTDATDTNLGEIGTDTVTVKAKITATQID